MIQALTRTLAVIVGSTILATLTVNAVDMRGHAVTTFLGAMLLRSTEEIGVCPKNMVLVDHALVSYCIDMYEASPGEECSYRDPKSNDETNLNIASEDCMPVSQANTMPWRNVTQDQARLACEHAGKRLATSDEWYKAALGTPDEMVSLGDEQCNMASNRSVGVGKTGAGMRCVSDIGVYDMVGNVWEWVDGTVTRGVWDGNTVPQTGYVHEVDVYGMPRTTGTAVDDRFNHDRFWSDSDIDAGIMRGGYYDSQGNAGIYSIYAASPASFNGDAVGFRCVTTISNNE